MNACIESLNDVGKLWWGHTLSMAWQLAAVFLIVAVLSLLFRRLPAAYRYGLWLLVLVKLLLPPSLAVVTGLGYWLRPPDVIAPRPAVVSVPIDPLPLPETSIDLTSALPHLETVIVSPSSPLQPSLTWQGGLFGAWLAIAIALLVLIATRTGRFRIAVRSGYEPADPGIVAAWERCKKNMGIKRQVRLVESSRVDSPVVVGIFRPVVVLPAGLAFRGGDLEPVLLHELAHVRRRDVLVNWIQVLLQVAYWYHPCVWLANRMIRRERERACDDLVLTRLGSDPREYASSLLDMARHRVRGSWLTAGFLGMAEPGGDVGGRIRRILDAGRRIAPGLSRWILVGLVALGATVLPWGKREATVAQEPASPAAAHKAPSGEPEGDIDSPIILSPEAAGAPSAARSDEEISASGKSTGDRVNFATPTPVLPPDRPFLILREPTEIRLLLTDILAHHFGVEFDLSDEVGGRVRILVREKNLPRILNLLLLPRGYVWEERDGKIFVREDLVAAAERNRLHREEETKRPAHAKVAAWLREPVSADIFPFAFGSGNVGDIAWEWGTVAGLDAVVDGDIHGRVSGNYNGYGIADVFDGFLIPRGIVWEQRGRAIIVTSSPYPTRVFPLTEDERYKLQFILANPEELESPEQDLKRMLYGESPTRETLLGHQLRLANQPETLIVSDTEENIRLVEEYLRNLDSIPLSSPVLTSGLIQLNRMDAETRKRIYERVRAYLVDEVGGGEEEYKRDGKRVFLDEEHGVLLVRDTPDNLRYVLENLLQPEENPSADPPSDAETERSSGRTSSELIHRSYALDPDNARDVYERVWRGPVEANGATEAHGARKGSLFLDVDTGILSVPNTSGDIDEVEEAIAGGHSIATSRPPLKARIFQISDDIGTDPESVYRRTEVVRGVAEILEAMLYEGDGVTREEARQRGRRILYLKTAEDEQNSPPFVGTITVVDSEENLWKLEKFLDTFGTSGSHNISYVERVADKSKGIEDLRKKWESLDQLKGSDLDLVTKTYAVDRDILKDVYELTRRFVIEELAGDEKTFREQGKLILMDEEDSTITLRDTPENIERVEEIVRREDISPFFRKNGLKARLFRITDDTSDDSESVRRRLEVTRRVVEILERMLYEGQGVSKEEANQQGRRILYPTTAEDELKDLRFIGTITVVDTGENLRKVQDFLGSAGGRRSSDTTFRRYPLDKKTAEEFMKDLREEWEKVDRAFPERVPRRRLGDMHTALRRVVVYDEENGTLIVRGEPDDNGGSLDIAIADELLARKRLTPEIKSGIHDVEVFRITQDTSYDAESVTRRLDEIQRTVNGLSILLYESEGTTEDEAWKQGRRIFYPTEPAWERRDPGYAGTITVVDTKENLEKVRAYLEKPRRRVALDVFFVTALPDEAGKPGMGLFRNTRDGRVPVPPDELPAGLDPEIVKGNLAAELGGPAKQETLEGWRVGFGIDMANDFGLPAGASMAGRKYSNGNLPWNFYLEVTPYVSADGSTLWLDHEFASIQPGPDGSPSDGGGAPGDSPPVYTVLTKGRVRVEAGSTVAVNLSKKAADTPDLLALVIDPEVLPPIEPGTPSRIDESLPPGYMAAMISSMAAGISSSSRESRRKEADDAKWEKTLDLVIPDLMFSQTDLPSVFGLLGNVSGFKFEIKEGVEGKVQIRVSDKTLRGILDMILLPRGITWERRGDTIVVNVINTGFRAQTYRLFPPDVVPADRMLRDPESLDDPELDIHRILYGDGHPSDVPGRQFQWNPDTGEIFIADTEENIAKLAAWYERVRKIGAERAAMIYPTFILPGDSLENALESAGASLIGESKTIREGNSLPVAFPDGTTAIIGRIDEGYLLIVPPGTNSERLERRLERHIHDARVFRVTADAGTDPRRTFERLELLRGVSEILEAELYGKPGRKNEEAHRQGRWMFYPETAEEEPDDLRFKGTITVVDTEENRRKAADFLGLAAGVGAAEDTPDTSDEETAGGAAEDHSREREETEKESESRPTAGESSASGESNREDADDAKWERKLGEALASFELPQPTEIETVLTRILGVLSGFQFDTDENIEGKAALRMQNHSLSEILDILLLPEGYVWERNGTTIKVWSDQHAARRRELRGATPEKEAEETKLRESLDRKLEGPLVDWKPKNVSQMLGDIFRFTPTDNRGGYVIRAGFDDEVDFEVGDKTVREILDEVLPPLGLNWDVVGYTIIVRPHRGDDASSAEAAPGNTAALIDILVVELPHEQFSELGIPVELTMIPASRAQSLFDDLEARAEKDPEAHIRMNMYGLVAKDRHPAEIRAGDDLSLGDGPGETIASGITFSVTPTVLPEEDRLLLDFLLEVEDVVTLVGAEETEAEKVIPVIDEHVVDLRIKLKSGEAAVFGAAGRVSLERLGLSVRSGHTHSVRIGDSRIILPNGEVFSLSGGERTASTEGELITLAVLRASAGTPIEGAAVPLPTEQ